MPNEISADDIIKSLGTPTKSDLEAGIRQLAQNRIYGSEKGVSLPSMQDNFRYEGYKKATNQNILEQSGNFLGQVAGEIVGGTIEGFGSLPGMVQQMFDSKGDFSNAVTEFGTSIKDWTRETMPIHRENPYTSFDVGDSAWWLSNGVSVASSLSLLIPSRAVMGIISKVGKLGKAEQLLGSIGNKLKVANELDDAGNILRTGADVFTNRAKFIYNTVGTAGLMRHMENFREATDVVKTTKEESMKVFNSVDFNKWKKDNDVLVKEYIHDNGEGEITKEGMSEYIAAKSGWQTYNKNWANIVFDIVQVAPLFKGFKAATRGAVRNAVTAEAEASLAGRTLSKAEKFGARFSPTVDLFKRQWTEGIEEMINYVSSQEGLRYGKTLLDKDYDKNSSLLDRTTEYLKDPQLWEQGFWGVMGGMTFEKVSTSVQDQYNKFKNSSYQSANEQVLNEINARKIISSNYVALRNLINQGTDITDVEGKTKYQGTPEEIEDKKTKAHTELVRQMAVEMGLNSSRVGTVASLLEYVKSDNFAKSISNEGNDVKGIQNEVIAGIEQAENSYKKYFNSTALLKSPQFVKDIIISDNVRKDRKIEYYNNRHNELNTQINDVFTNHDFFKTAEVEDKNNMEIFIRQTAAKGVKAQLDSLIANEKDATLKQIYTKALDAILPTLQVHIDATTPVTKVEFQAMNIPTNVVQAQADIFGLEFQIKTAKGEIANSISNPAVAQGHLDRVVNAANASKNKIRDEYNTSITKLNLNQEWEKVESEFNSIQDKIVAQFPDKKSSGINFAKDLKTLKAKHNNLKNKNNIVQPPSVINPTKTIEQEELEGLGVNLDTNEAADLKSFLGFYADENISNVDRKSLIDNDLINQLDNLDDTTKNVVLNYFSEKSKLLNILNDNVIKEGEETPAEQGKEVDNNESPFIEETEENNPQFEDISLNIGKDNEINLFINNMRGVNKMRNEKGNIVVSGEQAESIRRLFKLRKDSELTLRIDTDNQRYEDNKDSATRVPIGVFTSDGQKLDIFINELPYLENEIKLLNSLDQLTDDELLELIELSKDVAKRDAYKDFVKNKLIDGNEDIIKSHGGMESIIQHVYKVINFEKDAELNEIKIHLNNWKYKITRDYKANYDIRNKISKNRTKEYKVIIAEKTSGDLVISRNEDNEIVLNPIADIFTNQVEILIGTSSGVYFDKFGERITEGALSVVYDGAFYALINENGTRMPVLLKRNSISGVIDNDYNSKLHTFITEKTVELVEAIRSNNQELINELLKTINKYTYTDKDETKHHYLSYGLPNQNKDGKGFLKINTLKGEYVVEILAKVAYVKNLKDRTVNLGQPMFASAPRSEAYLAGVEALKTIMGERLRNVSKNDMIEEFGKDLTYIDEVTGKVYETYRDYVLETNGLITHYNHIVDEKGNHISYFTNKAENNSTNFRTSRPLIINVTTENNPNQDLSLVNISENDFKDEQVVIDKLEAVTSLPILHNALGLDYKYYFVFKLASDLGVEFNKEVQNNEGNAINANGAYENGTISLFRKFITQGNKKSRQITLIHELLHGVVDKSFQSLDPKVREMFNNRLGDFTKDLLNKLTEEKITQILESTKDINSVPTLRFSGNEQKYIKEILDLLTKIQNENDIKRYEEIITYAFSSPVFAEFLNNVESDLTVEELNENSRPKTFWDRLKELLLNIIDAGINIINGKVDKLTELQKILNETFDFNDDKLRELIEGVKDIKTEEKTKVNNVVNQGKLFEEINIAENTTIQDKIIDDNYANIVNYLIQNKTINKECP